MIELKDENIDATNLDDPIYQMRMHEISSRTSQLGEKKAQSLEYTFRTIINH